MFSRFLCSKLFKSSAPVISRCINTQFGGSKTNFPIFSSWIYKENDKIDTPRISDKIVLPNVLTYVYPFEETPKIKNDIIAPSASTDSPKEAVRLIIIRRKKMKKHKLRKLRKRMKFEWGKLRQRREFNKEKEFQATLIRQCKEAEDFSAEKYAEEKLNRLNEVVIPRYWKGKRLPEFLIRQKMGLPSK